MQEWKTNLATDSMETYSSMHETEGNRGKIRKNERKTWQSMQERRKTG